eukprot:TRINITY_DN21761_c0_g1_i1.p1 TRINITY_DN21761_c0_g1~~TRINITY_DN21761_c0_g1_i1.p1  ORF type:complete len:283 (+),score=33.42 TRINITY_DN21761_c0_g1_i1:135-983(+)
MHKVAEKGFNVDQSHYETARPGYPSAVIDFVSTTILPDLGSQDGAKKLAVLDLAAGTGKFTRLLQPFGIGTLIAVEPSPGMRKEFLSKHPELQIVDGSAMSLPFSDNVFDAIFIAQAFHWFSSVRALVEIARVLKPGGSVTLLWNMEDRSKFQWVGKLRDLYEVYDEGIPQYRKGVWRAPFDPDVADNGQVFEAFELPFQEQMFRHSVKNTKESIWRRVLSKSYVAVLDTEKQDGLKTEIEKVLEAEGEGIGWYEEEGGRMVVDFPFTTEVVWFRKRSSSAH